MTETGERESRLALPVGRLYIDTDGDIVAVNDAFLGPTAARRSEVIGNSVLDPLPGRIPATRGADETELVSLIERAASTGSDQLQVVQHDIVVPDVGGGRLESRHWINVLRPLRSEGRVVGTAIFSEDVSDYHELISHVLHLASALAHDAGVGTREREEQQRLALALALRVGRRLGQEKDEADQLRQALTGRAVIDQAKGMLMMKHGWSAEGAFAELKRLSSIHNVKLRAVADAIVHQEIGRSTPRPDRHSPSG